MSSCKCESSREYRITGEVVEYAGGEKEVRIRCVNCGGKVAYIDSGWLTELATIEDEDIVNGRCLSECEQVTITVDLI